MTQTSAGGASPEIMSTGITGSHRRSGDPSGGGTLTQRLSVVFNNNQRKQNGNRNFNAGDRRVSRGVPVRERNRSSRAGCSGLLDGKELDSEDQKMIRILAIAAAMVATTPATAGFIAIDGFSDPTQSDGLGDRTTEGLVTFIDDGLTMSAYAVSGATSSPIASVIYRFVPTPLVAAPIVRVLARNDQTHIAETGVLRVSVDGESIGYVLPGGQRDFVPYSFNFTSLLSGVASMAEIRIDWLREDGHGGAKQLVIDSIDVHAVPEPATLGLIGLAAGGAWIVKRKTGNKPKGTK